MAALRSAHVETKGEAKKTVCRLTGLQEVPSHVARR